MSSELEPRGRRRVPRQVRRAVLLGLFAVGCFGLGLAVARWTGWLTPRPEDVPESERPDPLIVLDASTIQLYDGSLTIHVPEPPEVPDGGI